MAEFLTWGEVQQRINKLAEQAGECYRFYDAVRSLWEENAVHIAEKLPLVSFVDWDLSDLDTFDMLYEQTPVDVEIFQADFLQKHSAHMVSDMSAVLDVIPCVLARNQSVNIHRHRAFEVLYTMRGEATLICGGNSRTLGQGEFCILSPGLPHDAIAQSNCTLISMLLSDQTIENTLSKLFRQDSILSQFFRIGLGGEKVGYQVFPSTNRNEIHLLLRSIFHEHYMRKEYAKQVCSSYVEILFTQILRQCGNNYEQYDEHKLSAGTIPLLAILKYIQMNYKTTSLSEVAVLFHYDPKYLSKIIKKNTGKGYLDIVREQRIAETKRLLSTTKLSMEHIAERAGYHNQVHFFREFRSEVGMTPGAYRKEQLEMESSE